MDSIASLITFLVILLCFMGSRLRPFSWTRLHTDFRRKELLIVAAIILLIYLIAMP